MKYSIGRLVLPFLSIFFLIVLREKDIMPKYNFMIAKAVDLVARKLAGMDSDTVARLTQVLSEEAQMISEELQHNGQNVNSDILAARLEGILARMKYEIRNQVGDLPLKYTFLYLLLSSPKLGS